MRAAAQDVAADADRIPAAALAGVPLVGGLRILGEPGRIDRLVGLCLDDVANIAPELAGQIRCGAGGNKLPPRFPADAVSREVA